MPGAVSASSPTVQTALSNVLSQAKRAKRPWGIYDQYYNKAISPDSIIDLNYAKGYNLPNAPVQPNSFVDWNKIELPFEASVLLVKGGTKQERRQFLQDCDTLVSSLNLYTIVTPEKRYASANCTRFEVNRESARGANFLEVRMYYKQIRLVNNSAFPTPVVPWDGSPIVNIGAVPTNLITPATFSGTLDAIQAGNTVTGSIRNAIKSAISAGQSAANSVASISNEVLNVANYIAGDLINGQEALANIAGTVINSVMAASSVVPLLSVASQTLSVQLGGQLAQLFIYTRSVGTFMDLNVNGNPIKTAMPCLDRNLMLQTAGYQGFKGDFTFVDTQGTTDPTYTDLGARHQLVYVGAPS